jgi:hypothetical protein
MDTGRFCLRWQTVAAFAAACFDWAGLYHAFCAARVLRNDYRCIFGHYAPRLHCSTHTLPALRHYLHACLYHCCPTPCLCIACLPALPHRYWFIRWTVSDSTGWRGMRAAWFHSPLIILPPYCLFLFFYVAACLVWLDIRFCLLDHAPTLVLGKTTAVLLLCYAFVPPHAGIAGAARYAVCLYARVPFITTPALRRVPGMDDGVSFGVGRCRCLLPLC